MTFCRRDGKDCLRFLFVGIVASWCFQNSVFAESRDGERNSSAQLTRQGNVVRAIDILQERATRYRARNQTEREIETLLELARGYIKLGKYRPAINELQRVVALAPSTSNLAIAQRRLGNAYIGVGNYERAISVYKSSLGQQTDKSPLSTLNNLARAFYLRRQNYLTLAKYVRQDSEARAYRALARRDLASALNYSQRAVELSQNETSTSAVRALIEWERFSQQELGERYLERGREILNELPPSRTLAYLMINWSKIDRDNRLSWLKRANTVARTIGNEGVQSYALLEMGMYYEENRDLERAIDSAIEAQSLAQFSFAYDSLYRAQRLAGKIHQKMGNQSAALEAYRGAIASIDTISRDLLGTQSPQIAKFNRDIEPIYRETLKLLLDAPQNDSASLNEALLVYDKLRLAQLRSYFGDNCIEILRENISHQNLLKEKKAALINSIILEDEVHFILQLGDGRILKSSEKITQIELEKRGRRWYRNLKSGNTWDFRADSRFFYDLIIEPFAAELEKTNPQVLVFINDGILRNLPMSALYDGEKFLAQKWASVSSIGLNFTSTREREDLKALVFGLEASRPGWSRLENVKTETNLVRELLGGERFLNDDFTVDNLTRQLSRDDYSVLHLATHGYFGGTAETSYVLAYEQEITAAKLEDILLQSGTAVELLVLSACETAVGSELSLLGLAGVAARSGIASTLGSLWEVRDDEQSQIIRDFYLQLEENNANRALALQRVQIERIRSFAHPQQWAALNLIGDW